MPPSMVDDDSPSDLQAPLTQAPAAADLSQRAAAKQPEAQPSIDAWAAPVEPSAEVKAAENEVLAASLAGLDGDMWGGSTFGQDKGQSAAAAEPVGKTGLMSAKGRPMAETEPIRKASETPSQTVAGRTCHLFEVLDWQVCHRSAAHVSC